MKKKIIIEEELIEQLEKWAFLTGLSVGVGLGMLLVLLITQ